MSREARPVFLNLLKIRLPIPGVVSILHRVSGVLLILFIPFSIYWLERVLSGPAGSEALSAFLWQPLGFLLGLLFLWSLLHHLLAGIRFLLIDLDIGITAASARKTAWAAILAALLLAVLLVIRWWS